MDQQQLPLQEEEQEHTIITNMSLQQQQQRRSFGCWQRVMKKANASLGSTMTAATSLLGSLDEEHEYNDDDDSLLWGDFDEMDDSRMRSSLPQHYRLGDDSYDEDDDDDDDDASQGSMDLNDLNRRPSQDLSQRFVEPHESFHASYDLGASLGQGAFGSVHKCFMKSDKSMTMSSSMGHNSGSTASSFAVKAVPMDKYNHEEIEILQDLKDCPSIVQLEDVFHELDESYIVMEEIPGGELLERIAEKECYSEQEAKVLFKTLLETVQYCHSKGIAHCDIKPENILLQSQDDDTTMKLVDFGLAKRFRNEDGTVERLLDMHGSAEYAAPEVFNRSDDDTEGYDERCDIWSCGVVLYVLLGGYAPFEADTTDDMIATVGKGKFKFHRRYWKHISRSAKLLIAKMLQVDPDKRCTLEEALASPWFHTSEEDAKNDRKNEGLRRMKTN